MAFEGKLTSSQIEEMCSLYAGGAKVTELEELFGITNPTIYYHLRKRGIQKQQPQKSPKKLVAHYKKCPTCGEDGKLEAKFCWKCGHKFKTDGEILMDEIQRYVGSVSGHLPTNMRDDYQKCMTRAVAYIRDAEGVQ